MSCWQRLLEVTPESAFLVRNRNWGSGMASTYLSWIHPSRTDYSAVPSIASPPRWMSLPTPDQVLQPDTVSMRIAKASAQKSTCLTFFTINLLFRRTSAWNIFSWTIHRYNNCCRYRLTIKKCSKNSPGPAFISFVDKPPAIRLYCRRLP